MLVSLCSDMLFLNKINCANEIKVELNNCNREVIIALWQLVNIDQANADMIKNTLANWKWLMTQGKKKVSVFTSYFSLCCFLITTVTVCGWQCYQCYCFQSLSISVSPSERDCCFKISQMNVFSQCMCFFFFKFLIVALASLYKLMIARKYDNKVSYTLV